MEDFLILAAILSIILTIFEVASVWITYEKAGAKGYAAIIPIYNVVVLFELANVPLWMLALLFVPIVNIYPLYLVSTSLAERLGRSKTFGVMLMLFPYICYPLLALSKTKIEKEYVNEEKEDNSVLESGPIEPLGAMPDIELKDIQAPSSITEQEVPITSTITPSIVSNVVDDYKPIENVVPINIEDPLQAQAKVQYVEDKKEIYPDVNIYKTCPNCGTKLEPTAKACFLCGKRLDEENS